MLHNLFMDFLRQKYLCFSFFYSVVHSFSIQDSLQMSSIRQDVFVVIAAIFVLSSSSMLSSSSNPSTSPWSRKLEVFDLIETDFFACK